MIETYGYWAVLVGTFLEGETVLVLAGFTAHQGYLQLPVVMLAACIGSLAGDQLLFYLGRRHSDFVLRHRPAWKQRFKFVEQKLMRHRNIFLISFRFLYGLRTVTPFMVGMSSVPTLVFVCLNAFSALLWAVVIGSGGYGRALELVLGQIKTYEIVVGVVLALIGLLMWLIHGIRRHRNKPV